MSHFSVEEIELYIQGKLNDPNGSQLREHLANCEACREQYEECRKNAEMADQVCLLLEDSYKSSPPAEAEGDQEPSGVLGSIEGYRLIREVYRGGQGVVYEAFQKATRRKVALKVLLGGSFAGDMSKRRFEREIELAANLHHRNIVTIHDSGVTRGNYYFVMDFVDGERLDDYVFKKNLPVREKIGLFIKICDAVGFAHQRGVLHRDLKPSNILVGNDGEPLILDFGLARRMDDREIVSVSTDGQLLGTPQYMSPEQAEGKVSDIDARTDVYALGLILYKMLTGVHPYPVNGKIADVLNHIVDTPPVRPSSLLHHLDMDIEVIALKALEKDPDRRYQSVAELCQDLQFWIQGLPIVARSVSSVYVLRKLITRHRFTSTAVGLLLLIILCFAYVSFDLYQTAQAAQVESETTRKKMRAEMEFLHLAMDKVTFNLLLQAWQAGQLQEAKKFLEFGITGKREIAAGKFLLNPQPVEKKEPEFRKEVGPDEAAFVDFIVGECYLKQENPMLAYDRYRKSKSEFSTLKPDRWLEVQVASRLKELSSIRNRHISSRADE